MSIGEVRQIDGKRVSTPEYRSWQMMKNRCLNKNARDFAYYGGRGISIDPTWLDFDQFLADMGRRPDHLLTLERLDTNKNYSAANCVWATRKTQARNRNYCKITMGIATKIRTLYKEVGHRQIDLAYMFSVSQRTISLIVRGEAWV